MPGAQTTIKEVSLYGVHQPHVAQGLAEGSVYAVARVSKHAVTWRAIGRQRPQLMQCDLRLGREGQRLRNTGAGPAVLIGGPLLGQIQLPGHRNAF